MMQEGGSFRKKIRQFEGMEENFQLLGSYKFERVPEMGIHSIECAWNTYCNSQAATFFNNEISPHSIYIHSFIERQSWLQ
jgi:hypothetical protein